MHTFSHDVQRTIVSAYVELLAHLCFLAGIHVKEKDTKVDQVHARCVVSVIKKPDKPKDHVTKSAKCVPRMRYLYWLYYYQHRMFDLTDSLLYFSMSSSAMLAHAGVTPGYTQTCPL